MDFSVISLIVLVVVVAIGFIKKVNLGFLSLGVAFILGTCGGMSAKEIAGGFSSSMFVTLVGVTFCSVWPPLTAHWSCSLRRLWLWLVSIPC